jgi:hypothetical protein
MWAVKSEIVLIAIALTIGAAAIMGRRLRAWFTRRFRTVGRAVTQPPDRP